MTSTGEVPTPGHVFISYVREDKAKVDQLEAMLKAANVPVWRDVEDLWPGEDWRQRIRRAVTEHSLAFIACFSRASNAKAVTHQREEVVLAVEQFRLRPPEKPWLFPVRFDDCELPYYDLGAGRTLESLNWVDLFGRERQAQTVRLVASVVRLLEEQSRPAAAGAVHRSLDLAEDIAGMLLDPTRQIELDHAMAHEARRVDEALMDDERFGVAAWPSTDDREVSARIVERVRDYDSVVAPLAMALARGCAWGEPQHQRVWARTLAHALRRTNGFGSGNSALIALRQYPVQPLLYAAGIGALSRENYGSLRAITVDTKIKRDNRMVPLVGVAHPYRPFQNLELSLRVLGLSAGNRKPTADELDQVFNRGWRGKHTPVQDHVCETIKDWVTPIIGNEDEYTDLFSRLELLLNLIATDEKEHLEQGAYIEGAWGGAFLWRDRWNDNPAEQRMRSEYERAGSDWAPLKARLFGGDPARAEAAFNTLSPQLAQARSRLSF